MKTADTNSAAHMHLNCVYLLPVAPLAFSAELCGLGKSRGEKFTLILLSDKSCSPLGWQEILVPIIIES